MPNTFTPIQSITLTGSAASVTFTAIPQTYTDLVLRWGARVNNADTQVWIRVNSNSTAAYSQTRILGNGSTATSARVSNNTEIYLIGGEVPSGAAANTFSSAELLIPNYTASTSKPISFFGANEDNATAANMGVTAGLTSISSAITSITLFGDGSGTTSFAAGSTFHLYGIRNS